MAWCNGVHIPLSRGRSGFEPPAIGKFFYGGACTKAGVSPLQGESGGFDFHRLHNRVMVYTEKLYSSIQSEGWCDEDTKYQWRYSTRPVGVVGSIPAVSALDFFVPWHIFINKLIDVCQENKKQYITYIKQLV